MIYGITGPAGSGKDTLALYLKNEHDYTLRSFAGPLKAGLAAMGLPEPTSREEKESIVEGFNFTWREAAQTLGTEWGRKLQQDLWLKMAVRGVITGDKVVFTDIRFPNEANTVRDLGGSIIHLSGRKADLGSNAQHVSEQPVEFVEFSDFRIDNSGTVEELYEKMFEVMYG